MCKPLAVCIVSGVFTACLSIMVEAASKLLSTKDAFQHALQSISNEIQKDIESMESYL